MSLSIKKLIYVANHRGTKENDLLLGPFATNKAPSFSEEEQITFEQFLQERDDSLYAWIMGQTPPPPQYASLTQEIREFAWNSKEKK